MSIDQKMLKQLSDKYNTYDLIKGHDRFISSYYRKHSKDLLCAVNCEQWYINRDQVLERFVKKYYLR